MVENRGIPASQGGTDTSSTEVKFRCCSKKCTVYVCVRCFATYHISCGARFKFTELDGNKVICCRSQSDGDGGSGGSSTGGAAQTADITPVDSDERFVMQITLLKKLVDEISDKNTILKDCNDLLKDKIKLMEREMKAHREINSSCAGNEAERERMPEASGDVADRVVGGIKQSEASLSGSDGVEVGDPALGNGGCTQPKTVSDSVHVNVQDGWQTVERKRRQTKDKNRRVMGSGSSFKIEGVPRRTWLFVGRLKPDVTEDHLSDHVKTVLSDEDVTCVKMNTRGRSQCFRVGVNIRHREVLLKASNWPVGVLVEPYLFFRGSGQASPASSRSPLQYSANQQCEGR